MSEELELPKEMENNPQVDFYKKEIQPLIDEIYRRAEEARISFVFHMDLDAEGEPRKGATVTSQFINHDNPPLHMLRYFKLNDE